MENNSFGTPTMRATSSQVNRPLPQRINPVRFHSHPDVRITVLDGCSHAANHEHKKPDKNPVRHNDDDDDGSFNPRTQPKPHHTLEKEHTHKKLRHTVTNISDIFCKLQCS